MAGIGLSKLLNPKLYLEFFKSNPNKKINNYFQVTLVALGKQLETDSFMELLFSLVGCLADWEFVAQLFKSVVHKVTTTMMITGMVEIMVICRTLTGQICERP